MLTFLEGETYYAPPNTSYPTRHFESGPYNKIILQRVDECLVGPVTAEVTLETSNDPAAPNWILVQDVPTGLSEGFGLAKFIRVGVQIMTTVGGWADATAYSLDDLVLTGNNIWACILAHTSSPEDEPEGTGSSLASWATATIYSVGNLVTGIGNGICYYCIQNHNATSADEPGVGANWQDYWMLNYLRYWGVNYEANLFMKISVYGKLVQA